HTDLLTGLEDWEGLSTYFEAKEDLTSKQRFTLTWAYLKQLDYLRARQTIEALAESNGDSVEAQRLLARACYFFDDLDTAAAAYDKVWDQILSRGYTTDIAYRAMIDFERGEIPRALSLLNGALQAVPDSVPVLNSLARMYASQGKLQEAEFYSNQVARQEEAHDKKVSGLRRRSSRIAALNLALEKGDYPGCERLIFQFLPEASDDFAEELILFLERMYRLVGREADFPDVLNRAQSARGKQ
ncbi:MAG: tetratricopeptide repeat protein, partial [bacterium]|nr:tetratricopeptide repeat protein [bacterium]